jgi:two-component system NtrC family sensor kinase
MLLRARLTLNFLVVVLITGIVSAVVGVLLIGDRIVSQAQNKVKMDLNSAWEVYNQRLRDVASAVRQASIRYFLRDVIVKKDWERLSPELDDIRRREGLDVLTLTDEKGAVVSRARHPGNVGDSQAADQIIGKVLSTHKDVCGTQIVPREELLKEGKELAERARIRFRETPHAKPRKEKEETSGMMIKAASPVVNEGGEMIGVLYGGHLLNRDFDVEPAGNAIVDKVKSIVYRGGKYKGKDIGTATIFQSDLRISTNVMDRDGNRAIGTRVSREVNERVLGKGKPWVDEAFVVNDWYITAYEPIRDVDDHIIGMLYVGLLRQEYVDLKKETLFIFLGIALAGMSGALAVAFLLSSRILRPIRRLVNASHALAQGDLSHKVTVQGSDEIGELCETFNVMADSLDERDRQLKEYMHRRLSQSEKLASLGRLAAGVAHEINNPLTGVLTFSHLLLKKALPDSTDKEDLEVIVRETTRCRQIVKELLDFARETKSERKPNDLNRVIRDTVSLVENQVSFQNVRVEADLAPELPQIPIDANEMQQVFTNLALNAAEAMPGGGVITIKTGLDGDQRFVRAEVTDTGTGIPEENLSKIFDPFFTTKEAGAGTGLGLAVTYGIVQRHEGTIEVKSEEHKGTTFIIRLPRSMGK